MPSDMAQNAILAKARAMYGKCLSDTDYKQLMECRTVPEVAAYLKTRTNYKSALTGLNENDVHRGQLEPMLRQGLYSDVIALSRYSVSTANIFSEFMLSEMEIKQIIRCLTLVNIGRGEEYVYHTPLSMGKFARIDLEKLTTVRTYNDALEVLSGSRYYQTLMRFRPKDGEKVNMALLESELYNQNYKATLEAVSKTKKSRDKDELEEIVLAIFDIRNISRIMRLKRYFNYSAERIRPLLIPYGKLSKKTMDELCSCESAKEAFELARSTYLGRQISRMKFNDPSQIASFLISIYCKHHLRLSPNPTIVMVSYVYLKEIELENIVNIIEATRYGLVPEEKARLLVR